ncbi:MAG: heme exporter protein CcmD [Rhodospirillales bacterium CG15_BIG_FIL_POST_REV_8_21_14_020_66_15]|nr:MAG: heme exporter protein CcmD [Rhodospirillales bacterium CG15_BIG_FIL_POST_REV_8_21_14_020_66_15]
MGKFLEMGGYAGFVWPSYAAVLAVLAVLLWLSLRGLRAAEGELSRLEGDAGGARRGGGHEGASET